MLSELSDDNVDFIKATPEGLIGIDGHFRSYVERFSIVCIDLTLSIDSPAR
jgi:hypothetical protein